MKNIPYFYASFYLNSKLFICGGHKEVANQDHIIHDFFSYSLSGKQVYLSSLPYPKELLSLSGCPHFLITAGGQYNE